MEKQIKLVLNSKEVFSPDPDNPEQMIMALPPEIVASAGFNEGDEIKVSLGDQGTIILEKI